MNAAQAKRISLYDLLSSLGQVPADTRKSGNEIWYQSPFRQEKEASFKIKLDQNVWYDFGEGEGGNILDFVMKYNRCGFNEALSFLDNRQLKRALLPVNNSSREKQPTLDFFNIESPLITEVKPVSHFALKEYLKARGISSAVGYKHLKEIHYKVNDKPYFALGFKNTSNGYEVRNPLFKGCLGKKDISVIETGADKTSIFEGFMDFLSYEILHGELRNSDVIVLNSTSMKKTAVELIKANNYHQLETYLDNDKGGAKTLAYLENALPGTSIRAMNHLYEPHKDFNEFLVNRSARQLFHG